LTNQIREKGYRSAFKNCRILTKPVTNDIDRYLKSSKINGLSWKSLGITPDTKFPNDMTKYDQ
jgi:hypothetical protein